MKRHPALRNLPLAELEQICVKLQEPKYRARQLCNWLYRKDAAAWNELSNLPQSFLDKLSKGYTIFSLRMVREYQSQDRCRKFLFQTEDEEYVESVLIPSADRLTLCLSTQIGCPLRCTFCASGKKGWVRNLSCAEILDQVSGVRRTVGKSLTNIVYMGMGEPFLNYSPVVQSLRTLLAPWGYGLGERRITISTAGITPALQKFLKEGLDQVKLSLSLHAADERLRSRLMPVTKRYSLRQLVSLLKRERHRLKRDLTLEYMVLKGTNDRPGDIQGLIHVARELKAKVNLIPYNPVEGISWTSATRKEMEAIRTTLQRGGIRTTLRFSAGADIQAACGQLRLIEKGQDQPS